MSQIIGAVIGNPIVGVALVVVVVVVAVAIRVYSIRRPGAMNAKCPKCGVVFEASRSFSGIHLGPYKQLKCPACGKISFMNAHVKEPVTYPPLEEKSGQQPESAWSEEEREKRLIEESKYERA